MPFEYDLYVVDAQSGKSRALQATKVSRYNRLPTFTPDGARILFLGATEWNSGSRPIYSIAGSGLFTVPDRWSQGAK